MPIFFSSFLNGVFLLLLKHSEELCGPENQQNLQHEGKNKMEVYKETTIDAIRALGPTIQVGHKVQGYRHS